jgi:hypothetical protein
MVIGLLAWLAWEVDTDITIASQLNGQAGIEDEHWYAVQLLAVLAPWLVDDHAASAMLEESVARTPRYRVDGDRWLAVHRSALATFAIVETDPDAHGQLGRQAHPGDLVVLRSQEDPRVRVVLDVIPGNDGGKVVLFDPNDEEGLRSFLSSRMATLSWDVQIRVGAAAV